MLKLVKDSNPQLRNRSIKVEEPYLEEDKKIIREMLDYLKKSQDDEYAKKHHMRAGVGLAAPQIGIQKQMIAVYYEGEKGYVQYGLINPKITSTSVKLCYLRNGEGCLSVDKEHPGHIYRPYKIRVKGYDILQEKEIEIVAKGYDAIVLQHEIDHLQGILFYDHIDPKAPMKVLPDAIEI